MRFWRRNPDIEDRLRAERPEPGAHLVKAIEEQIELTAQRRRRYRPTRPVYALGLTTALMGALAMFGGLSYAAVSVSDGATQAAKIVKVTVGLEAAKPSASARINSSPDAKAAKKRTICHRKNANDPGKTLTLSEKNAQKHLQNHPFDTDGPCPPPPCDDDDADDDEYCDDDDSPVADRARQ